MNCLERYNQLVLMILRSLDTGPQYPFLIPALDACLQKVVEKSVVEKTINRACL